MKAGDIKDVGWYWVRYNTLGATKNDWQVERIVLHRNGLAVEIRQPGDYGDEHDALTKFGDEVEFIGPIEPPSA